MPGASHEVVTAAIAVAPAMGIRHHAGLTRSAHTFYAGHAAPGSSYGGYRQSWWRDHVDDLARQNILAAEMEASVIFVLARLWGLRAGGVAVMLDHVRHVSDGKEFGPDTQFEHGDDLVERLAPFACEVA